MERTSDSFTFFIELSNQKSKPSSILLFLFSSFFLSLYFLPTFFESNLNVLTLKREEGRGGKRKKERGNNFKCKKFNFFFQLDHLFTLDGFYFPFLNICLSLSLSLLCFFLSDKFSFLPFCYLSFLFLESS